LPKIYHRSIANFSHNPITNDFIHAVVCITNFIRHLDLRDRAPQCQSDDPNSNLVIVVSLDGSTAFNWGDDDLG
jgi:hypothetical protein